MSGIFNSLVNNWPTVFIAGSCETHLVGSGAFQELDQVTLAKPYTKLSAKPNDVSQIGKLIRTAFNTTVAGKPGPVYLDFPADYIQAQVDPQDVHILPKFARTYCSPSANNLSDAAAALLTAKAPLIIIGKGAALSRTEDSIAELVDILKSPFLPTPMGKGVVSDLHELNCSAARSLALESADVILVLGARLNWILHFGKKFSKSAKIIHADIDATEISKSLSPPSSLPPNSKRRYRHPAHRQFGNDGGRARRPHRAVEASDGGVQPANRLHGETARKNRNEHASSQQKARVNGAANVVPRRVQRAEAADSAQRGIYQRGRQHDGHCAVGVRVHGPAVAAGCRHVGHDGRWPRLRHRSVHGGQRQDGAGGCGRRRLGVRVQRDRGRDGGARASQQRVWGAEGVEPTASDGAAARDKVPRARHEFGRGRSLAGGRTSVINCIIETGKARKIEFNWMKK
ncbi:putative 2-hydroxyacyl-CoA lyase [Smittium culicis]|uniref:Putative 2-hydroxyacyl-CoA lyase n=1 Tax=Smittium culicis TaxID=133412 RepID=A0A1R1XQ51_9FUNG|nr:putative 2-hydroxyacyl-CoA lyase [Smittium culicis]